jgi:fructose-1,6-bisphosphatase
MNPDLKQFGIVALREAHANFLRLVKEGSARDNVSQNQFGEMAMQIDIVSEEVIIKYLRILSEKVKRGIRVVSEEHGEFVIGDKPDLTAFLDGFDGSSVFRDSKGKSRGGTMFALYESINLRFQDYLSPSADRSQYA